MITPELLRSWGNERIVGAFGASALSPREMAARSDIDLDERMWVLGRVLVHLDERAARLFAIETALTVAHLAGDEDDEAIFRGLMNDLLCAEDLDPAARDAARDAARATANDMLWKSDEMAAAAAWNAAYDAARASWIAASSTALVAARTAAEAARLDAKTERSIDHALGKIGDVWRAARAAVGAAEEIAERTARNAALERSIACTLEWLGDYADGWEEP
jgi:hypothetical protein